MKAFAFTQSPTNINSILPQDQIPFKHVTKLEGDEKTCQYYFMFSCPYCYAYHHPISNWGRSLPAGWKFKFVPVLVEGSEGFITVKAFNAVKKAAPEKISEFMSAAYIAFQRQGLRANEEDTWIKIVSNANIDLDDFGRAWGELTDNEGLFLEPLIKRQEHYNLVVTPTAVINGEYIVTPDNTQGDEGLFIQLLSGLVSKADGVL